MYLGLKGKFETRNPRFLDLVYEEKVFHGDYQVVRSVKKSLEYLQKEDLKPLTNMSLDKSFLKKEIKKKALCLLKDEGLNGVVN